MHSATMARKVSLAGNMFIRAVLQTNPRITCLRICKLDMSRNAACPSRAFATGDWKETQNQPGTKEEDSSQWASKGMLEKAEENIKKGASDVVGGVKETFHKVTEGEVAEKISQKAEQAKDDATNTLERASRMLSDAVKRAEDKMAQFVQGEGKSKEHEESTISDLAHEATAGVKKVAERVTRSMGMTAKEAVQAVDNYMDDEGHNISKKSRRIDERENETVLERSQAAAEKAIERAERALKDTQETDKDTKGPSATGDQRYNKDEYASQASPGETAGQVHVGNTLRGYKEMPEEFQGKKGDEKVQAAPSKSTTGHTAGERHTEFVPGVEAQGPTGAQPGKGHTAGERPTEVMPGVSPEFPKGDEPGRKVPGDVSTSHMPGLSKKGQM